MTTCRNGVGVAAVGDALYAFGGFDGSTPLKTAERYDPSTHVWQPIASMNEQRYGVGVALCEGQFVVQKVVSVATMKEELSNCSACEPGR